MNLNKLAMILAFHLFTHVYLFSHLVFQLIFTEKPSRASNSKMQEAHSIYSADYNEKHLNKRYISTI